MVVGPTTAQTFEAFRAAVKPYLDGGAGDVVKVLESAALGWVRARVIRVKSGGRVVVQSDQGREFTARGNQVRLIEPAGFRP